MDDIQSVVVVVGLVTNAILMAGIAVRNERRHSRTDMLLYQVCTQLDIKHPGLPEL